MDTAPAELFIPIDATDFPARPSPLQLRHSAWQRYRADSMGLTGLLLLAILFLFMLFGPLLSGYAYDELHMALKNQPPSPQFWFGTDDLGRDLFTRVWYGARISFCVGIAAALVDLTIGVLWGSLAGYFGGRIDEWLMRFLDILYTIPSLLTAILFTVVLGTGLFSLIVAISIISWITMARIVRGQILLLKEMDYVMAARSIGAGTSRILFRHLLPNAWGPILITLTMTIPAAMFNEAFLSFLGLGVQAPMASWGTTAYDGLPAMQYYPWRLLFPAVLISLTMLSFYLIGEGLKAAFSKSSMAAAS